MKAPYGVGQVPELTIIKRLFLHPLSHTLNSFYHVQPPLPETPFLLKTSTSFLHTVHRTCKTLIPKWPEAMYLHMIQQLVPSIEAFLSGSLAARVPAVESYMLWGMLVLVAFEICLSSERAAADGACVGVWCAR